MQMETNKIAYIYLGAYFYLNIWVLHKTDSSNFFAKLINAFFQYILAIVACWHRLERLNHTSPAVVKVFTCIFINEF